MSYSLAQQIAECYRRAEDYRRLYEQSSSLEERERYFLATVSRVWLTTWEPNCEDKSGNEFESKTSRRK